MPRCATFARAAAAARIASPRLSSRRKANAPPPSTAAAPSPADASSWRRVSGAFTWPQLPLVGLVAVVQHEVVAVRVAEERHVADARVQRLAVELHAALLQRGPCGGDVVDAERERVALLRLERHAHPLRLPDAEARVAGPALVFGVRVGPQAEDVAVKGPGAVGVL